MRLILLLVLTSIFQFSFAQNFLLLKNTQTGKTRKISSGAKLYIKMGEDSDFIKGKIMQIKDSVVVVYFPDNSEDTPISDIKLSDITQIKKATHFHAITRTISAVTVPIGTILLGAGIVPLLRKDDFQGQPGYNKDQAKVSTTVGAGLIITGIIPYLFNQKVYDLRKDWTLSVEKVTKK